VTRTSCPPAGAAACGTRRAGPPRGRIPGGRRPGTQGAGRACIIGGAIPGTQLQGAGRACGPQAPGFPEQVLDLVALVLAGMAGPDAPACIAAAADPARAQARVAPSVPCERLVPKRGRRRTRPLVAAEHVLHAQARLPHCIAVTCAKHGV